MLIITTSSTTITITTIITTTVKMQANVLAWILLERITLDGKKQCKISPSGVTMCTGAAEGIDANGNPPERKGFALSLQYTKVSRYFVFVDSACSILQHRHRFARVHA